MVFIPWVSLGLRVGKDGSNGVAALAVIAAAVYAAAEMVFAATAAGAATASVATTTGFGGEVEIGAGVFILGSTLVRDSDRAIGVGETSVGLAAGAATTVVSGFFSGFGPEAISITARVVFAATSLAGDFAAEAGLA